MKNKIKNMKEIVHKLQIANKAYYEQANPIMQDREYDKLYDELLSLEEETGIILGGSPTQKVGYDVSTQWDKINHEFPALSLNKTKDRNELVSWLAGQEGVLSWKLDGLTVIMTYDNNKLTHLCSRGNGITGEVLDTNAPFVYGVPQQITYSGHLVVRGEALISYNTFNSINDQIKNENDKFKTCRNLASGTIRNLDSKIVASRNVEVKAFELVYMKDMPKTVVESFEFLSSLGFDVVEYEKVNKNNLKNVIEVFEKNIRNNPLPSDGLVLDLDDIAYGKSLGLTSKFPRNAIAYKWNDDTYETVVTGIDWSPSKNSINPVLEFESVNIDGSDVSRCSIHNINIMKSLELGIGDVVEIYLANKIIPQVAENQTRSNTLTIPDTCPVCGEPTKIKVSNDGTQTLVCTNNSCQGKLLGKLKHFVGKSGMNITNLSEATLSKFIDKGWINNFYDIYKLKDHINEIINLDGFGVKSAQKLFKAIEDSKETSFENFVTSLSIQGIGSAQSKILGKVFNHSWNDFIAAINSGYSFINLESFGDVLNKNIHTWYRSEVYKQYRIEDLVKIIKFKIEESQSVSANNITNRKDLSNMIFVITGSLDIYNNRDGLKAEIEARNGKVSGSISKKTNYLICNQPSNTGKSKKAQQLGVPIITEQYFIDNLF